MPYFLRRADRFKTSLQFVPLPYRKLYAALDACKVADYVVFALSSEVEVDNWGDTLLRALQAQGLPEVVTAIASPTPMDAKAKSGIMKSLLSFIQYFVPSQMRVFDLHASADRLNALRTLCEGKPTDVKWREGRSYVLGESVQWADGTLAVTGVVRGAPMSADRLVHVPNYGDFQVEKVPFTFCLDSHTRLISLGLLDYVCATTKTLKVRRGWDGDRANVACAAERGRR